jgi:hypothetical protein
LERLRASSSRLDALQKENQRLAKDLEQALKTRKSATPTAENYRPGGFTPGPSSELSPLTRNESASSNAVPWKKHQELIARFNTVCENYKTLLEVKSDLEAVRNADKQQLRKWNTFKDEQDARVAKKDERIQRQREEIQRLRAQLKDFTGDLEPPSAGGKDKSIHHDDSGVDLPRTSLARHLFIEKTIENGDGGVIDLPLPEHNPNILTDIDNARFENKTMEHHKSSSTDGSDTISPIKLEPEDHIPKDVPSSPNSVVVLSSRSLKKRKGQDNITSSKNAIKVEEDIGSSPLGLAAIFSTHDSMDLDDIGEKVDTPRKRKQIREFPRRVSPGLTSSPLSTGDRTQVHSHSKSTEATELTRHINTTAIGRQSSILQPRSVNTPILPRTSEERVPKKRRIASDEAVGGLMEDGEIASASAERTTLKAVGRLENLLAKPSPPKQMLSPSKSAASTRQLRTKEVYGPSRLANEVERAEFQMYISPYKTISVQSKQEIVHGTRSASRESADRVSELESPSSRSDHRSPAEPGMPISSGNSDGLLATPKPVLHQMENSADSRSKANESTRLAEFFKRVQTNVASAGQAIKENDALMRSPCTTPTNPIRPSSLHSIQPSTTNKRRTRLNTNAAEEPGVEPDHEPLRLRPVQSFTLQDFKVNPNYNQGFNYAFSEVVRGKDARKCLQGCTKPGCCGFKFRALVEGLRDPNKPLTASQEEADSILLEEYLGGDTHKLRNMSKEERDELVIVARTRDYANKHGKHRHAFERPASPPGFWRADMPTTQEENEDRVKAKEREKNLIEERYREAMRKGGRYIFRDE